MTTTSTPRRTQPPAGRPTATTVAGRRPGGRPRPAPVPVTRRRGPAGGMSAARVGAWLVGVGSGFALFFVVFVLVLSPIQQSRTQSVLYTRFRSELAAATAPFGVTPIPLGDPVAVIVIPTLGVRQVVVEGTTAEDLRDGPGHLPATVLPGQLGTSVIFGRSTSYGAPFRDLPSLHKGDPLQVTTGQGLFTYTVEDVRHSGDPQPPALGAGQSRLLLVTTDHASLGASSTVYIDALLHSSPAVTPPRAAVFTSTPETELAPDPAALLPLALWLLVLIAAGVFAAWGLANWGRSQTWLIVAPILLVALWGACDNAAMLLPNLM